MKRILLTLVVMLNAGFVFAQSTTLQYTPVLPDNKNGTGGYNTIPLLNNLSSKVAVSEKIENKNIISKFNADDDPQLPFMNVFVVPNLELVMVQWKNLNTENRDIILADTSGCTKQKVTLYSGSTIVSFNTQTLYGGQYEVGVYDGTKWLSKKITIIK